MKNLKIIFFRFVHKVFKFENLPHSSFPEKSDRMAFEIPLGNLGRDLRWQLHFPSIPLFFTKIPHDRLRHFQVFSDFRSSVQEYAGYGASKLFYILNHLMTSKKRNSIMNFYMAKVHNKPHWKSKRNPYRLIDWLNLQLDGVETKITYLQFLVSKLTFPISSYWRKNYFLVVFSVANL